MNNRTFWPLLGIISIVVLVSLAVMNFLVPVTDALSVFILVMVALFAAFVAFAYVAGVRAANSNSSFRFIQLVMMLMIAKMLLCVGAVVAYVKINQPETKFFVIPFLFVYLIFTIFEVYVLLKISRIRPSRNDDR